MGEGGGRGEKPTLCKHAACSRVLCTAWGKPLRTCSGLSSGLALLGRGREADAESLVTIVAILSILLQLSNLMVMEVVF